MNEEDKTDWQIRDLVLLSGLLTLAAGTCGHTYREYRLASSAVGSLAAASKISAEQPYFILLRTASF